MSSINLDCSQLRDIRLHSDLPNSIYIDGEQFLRQFEQIVQQMAYEKPLRKVSFRTKRMTSREVSLDGYFHQWGTEIYENREGQDFVTQTIAVVESVDGGIYKIGSIYLTNAKEYCILQVVENNINRSFYGRLNIDGTLKEVRKR